MNWSNWSIKELTRILLVVAVLTGGMVFGASDVWGQEKGKSTAQQLIGHWTLVSVKNEQGGKTTEPFGPNPKGLFIFDRSGRYVVLQFASDLPKFASNSRDKGTPAIRATPCQTFPGRLVPSDADEKRPIGASRAFHE